MALSSAQLGYIVTLQKFSNWLTGKKVKRRQKITVKNTQLSMTQ